MSNGILKKKELVYAYGHEIIRSTHRTTFEVTKDRSLTERGDCIVGVNASKAAAYLSSGFKGYARNADAEITIMIEAGDFTETVRAKGDPGLSFTDNRDIVVRKSTYVCGRTVAVRADKAAADLSRKLVERLQKPNQRIKITLTVEVLR